MICMKNRQLTSSLSTHEKSVSEQVAKCILCHKTVMDHALEWCIYDCKNRLMVIF